MITHFFFVAVLMLSTLIPSSDHVRMQYFILLLGLTLYLGRLIWKRDRFIAVAWVATAWSFINAFGNPVSPFGKNALYFDSVTMSGFAQFMIITGFALLIKKRSLMWLEAALKVFCYMSSIALIWNAGFGDYNRDIFTPFGLLKNGGLDATFLGVMLPLINWPCVLLPIAAIMISKSSTGLMCLGIYCGVELIRRWKKIPLGAKYFFISLPILGVCYIGDKELFSGTGRFEIWQLTLGVLRANPDHWLFGYGAGSFFLAGPMMQKVYGLFPHLKFTWAHNEFIQVFFEQGLVGFTIIAVMLIRHVRSLPLLLYVLCAFTQPVLRVPLLAFLGAVLIRLNFQFEPESLRLSRH